MTDTEKPPGLLALLFDPVRFIQARTRTAPSLLGSCTVFLSFLVPYMIALIALANKVVSALPDYLEPDMVKSLVFFFTLTVISQGIAGVILWVVGTGMLTCLSIIFDGDAEYRKLLELSGLSFLPCALSALGMMIYVLPLDLAITYNLERGMSEANLKREVVESIHGALSTTGFRIVSSFNLIGTIWTAVLMVLALRFAGKLSYGKSLLSLLLMAAFFGVVYWLRRAFNIWSM